MLLPSRPKTRPGVVLLVPTWEISARAKKILYRKDYRPRVAAGTVKQIGGHHSLRWPCWRCIRSEWGKLTLGKDKLSAIL